MIVNRKILTYLIRIIIEISNFLPAALNIVRMTHLGALRGLNDLKGQKRFPGSLVVKLLLYVVCESA